MKTHAFYVRTTGLILGMSLALFVAGCGDSAQQQAFEQAATTELQFSAENAASIIADYQRVIALRPGSEWARKAQARIAAVEARLKAEELRKSVFQEHGVD